MSGISHSFLLNQTPFDQTMFDQKRAEKLFSALSISMLLQITRSKKIPMRSC